MFKKKVVIGAIIIIFIFAVILGIIILLRKPTIPPQQEIIPFSFDPLDWIEPVGNNTFKINVTEATEGFGDYFSRHEHFIMPDGSIAAIYLDGTYNGEIFTGTYLDQSENIRMRIFPDMNPNNGIIEGFALFKLEHGEIVFYLFVDEDWKRKSNDNINIIWGKDIRKKEDFHVKKFDFTMNQNGIYVDKITEETDWFLYQNPKWGRLFFGEITREEIIQKNYNSTFILIY